MEALNVGSDRKIRGKVIMRIYFRVQGGTVVVPYLIDKNLLNRTQPMRVFIQVYVVAFVFVKSTQSVPGRQVNQIPP